MAIAPTGAIYKALSFDNVSSRNYGVYITGQAVYNAPTRDVEMISIPGRNGAFALDKGRFENIEVSYPAGIFADNETDFAEAISNFRNFLCSRNGYVRLTDEYNPDEYRMAIYKSGLEVSPAQLKAGEFEIVFDCKPQRWLTSGETAVTIGEWGETETVSGDIVSVENPNGVLAVKSLEVDLEPIQSGPGDPSPSNVRPISGHTDVVVSRAGKNLCDTSLVYNGYINVSQQKIASNANARTLYLPCKPNTAYTVSKQAGQRFVVAESTAIPTNDVVVSNIVSDYTASSITITTSASAKYLVAFVYLSTADTGVTADQMLATCQIELGSMATTYEPYQCNTYTTALGTTVYKGILNVLTGELTVTHKLTTLTGASDENWSKSSNSTYDIFLFYDANQLSDKEYYCNRFMATTQTNKDTIGWVWQGSSNHQFCFCYGNHSSMTADDFKTWVSSNNIQLCTELATATVVQLTAQQISTLLGQNNIWASSGDVTVEYGQDPNKLINPTLFESSPMLEVEGYGNIDFNGYNIELENETLGTVTLWNSGSYSGQYRHPTITRTFQQGLLNSGDNFTINGLFWSVHHVPFGSSSQLVPSNPTASITVSGIENTISNASGTVRRNEHGDWLVDCDFDVTVPQIGFVFGTAKTEQATVTCNISVVINAETKTKNYVQTVNINYDGNNVVTFEWINQETLKMNFVVPEARGESSVSLLGHPTYIDCDLGAAYMIKSGDVISLNQYIDLGSELPTLAAGANEITCDNTVTELRIIPRWWKV